LYFVVDTLEYLAKAAIGGAKALLGELIQIKPVLAIVNGQARTSSSATQTLAGGWSGSSRAVPKDCRGVFVRDAGGGAEEADLRPT
jgi:hypothetical protein